MARRVVMLVAAVHMAIAWFGRAPGIGWGEDDAQYFNLARDLARFGYHESWNVAAPFHVRYPPLFPALLALVGIPTGWSVDAMQLVIALCSALAIVIFFEAAWRRLSLEMALLASVLWAFNPLVVREGGWLLSEPLFGLFLSIALWGIAREDEGTRFGVVAGAGFVAAALTRTAGAAMVVGLLAYWLLRWRWKRAGVLAVVAGGTIGVWVLYSFLSPESESQRLYSADIAKMTATAPAVAPGDRAERATGASPALEGVRRWGSRLERITTQSLPVVLAFRTVRGTIVDNLVWFAILVGTGTVGVLLLFRMWPGAALPFAVYALLMTVWTWMMERYLSPLIPLLYLVMLLGASWLAHRVAPRWRAGAVLALVLLLLTGELQQTATLPMERARCHAAQAVSSEWCYPRNEREYLALAQWVRDSTPERAVFLASKEAAFYTHSGRRVMNQIRALQEDSATIIPYLRTHGVNYVAVGEVGVRALRHGKLMASVCNDLILVREFELDFAVLRVRGADQPTDGGAACRVLAPWRDRRPAPDRVQRLPTAFFPTSTADDTSAANF